jgi:hypothetical protein
MSIAWWHRFSAPTGQELFPGRAAAAGRGIDPGVVQDLPDRGGCDRVAEPDKLALYPPVPPPRVVRRDADDELADRGCRGRPPGTPPAGVVPFAGDQAPVPGQQRRRGHREHLAAPVPRNQPGQCGKHNRSAGWQRIRPIWRRSTVFSCRRTSSSASLDTSPRPRTIRQASRPRTSR